MSIDPPWDYAVKTMLESLEDDRLHQQSLLDGDMDSIHAALRRKHVRTAIADSRIEGFPPPSPLELEIYAAYIRGEIDAGDLVEVYIASAMLKSPAATAPDGAT